MGDNNQILINTLNGNKAHGISLNGNKNMIIKNSVKNRGIKVNGDRNIITGNKLGKTKGKNVLHRLCIGGYKNIVKLNK